MQVVSLHFYVHVRCLYKGTCTELNVLSKLSVRESKKIECQFNGVLYDVWAYRTIGPCKDQNKKGQKRRTMLMSLGGEHTRRYLMM